MIKDYIHTTQMCPEHLDLFTKRYSVSIVDIKEICDKILDTKSINTIVYNLLDLCFFSLCIEILGNDAEKVAAVATNEFYSYVNKFVPVSELSSEGNRLFLAYQQEYLRKQLSNSVNLKFNDEYDQNIITESKALLNICIADIKPRDSQTIH